jgi:hypothetical protein
MRLFVDISSHGFGHLAQTAPVLNALRQRLPQLELTIRCGLPRERIARRISGDFTHLAAASDFGLVMKSALEVDVPASLASYRELHADWEARVEQEAHVLAEIGPDLVLSNISYLALAGAQQAGIPNLAMCSLNWASTAAPYFRDAADFAAIHAQMLAAYRGAQVFLRLTPGMEMPELGNVETIGPVAQPGESKRAALPAAGRIVLVAMGGVGARLPSNWPAMPGVQWIVAQNSGLRRHDVLTLEDTGLSVSDLIASVDCVITKAGYGTFVEAAASGTPLLYVARPDWPEEAALATWLASTRKCARISRAQFERGDFGELIERLMAGIRPKPVELTGIAQAADLIAARLTSLPSPASGGGAGGEGAALTPTTKAI